MVVDKPDINANVHPDQPNVHSCLDLPVQMRDISIDASHLPLGSLFRRESHSRNKPIGLCEFSLEYTYVL